MTLLYTMWPNYSRNLLAPAMSRTYVIRAVHATSPRRVPQTMSQIVTTRGLHLALAELWDAWDEPSHRGSREKYFHDRLST
eukprot:5929723-Prymnesium_polylepis.1